MTTASQSCKTVCSRSIGSELLFIDSFVQILENIEDHLLDTGLLFEKFFDGLHCGGTGIARFFPGIPQALSDLQNGTLANPLDVHPRTSLEDPNAQPAEGETPDGEVTQQEG